MPRALVFRYRVKRSNVSSSASSTSVAWLFSVSGIEDAMMMSESFLVCTERCAANCSAWIGI